MVVNSKTDFWTGENCRISGKVMEKLRKFEVEDKWQYTCITFLFCSKEKHKSHCSIEKIKSKDDQVITAKHL